jgi:enoyl-CoA hydratase/carnithine racemase
MTPVEVPVRTIAEHVQRGALADTFGPLIIAVPDGHAAEFELGSEPCVVVGIDVVPRSPQETSRIIATVNASPIASISACLLLRSTTRTDGVDQRLVLESTTYSMLQAGPEFARWLASYQTRPTMDSDTHPLIVERIADTLHLILNRPRRSNAFSASLRQALCDALLVAEIDETITRVSISGNGANFCTGGDLNEFGTFESPAASHVVRLQQSPARSLARLHRRLSTDLIVNVHGQCIGSGIELAAFGGRVVAEPNSTFWLPEIALGLVPGAGGTISIVDRIGSQRTALLLLAGEVITADTALMWGLIDEITAPEI